MRHNSYHWTLDGRNRKDEAGAISLVVSVNGGRKYYPIGESVSNEQWDLVKRQRSGDNVSNRSIRNLFIEAERFWDIINMMGNYERQAIDALKEIENQYNNTGTITDFDKCFTTSYADKNNTVVKDVLEKMLDNGKPLKPRTEGAYRAAYNQLYNYYRIITGKSEDDFYLHDIDVMFLDGFRKFKHNKSCVDTYFRHIKHLVKYAIDRKYIPESRNPFRKDGIIVRQAKTRNIALNDETFSKLFYADKNDALTPAQKKSIKYLIVCWYCNGCNPMDFLRFRHCDIVNNTIKFTRTKTENTNQTTIPIKIKIGPDLQQIINDLGTQPNAGGTNYIFPVLNEKDDMEEISKKVDEFRHRNGHNLRKAIKKLGINIHVNFDVMRHTFATHHYQHNNNLAKLSEAMGHSNLSTTLRYIDSIDVEGSSDAALEAIESVIHGLKCPY